MRWTKAAAAFIRALFTDLDETPKVIESLADIQNNHLMHLSLAITDVSARVGRIEGKLTILLAVCGMLLMTVLSVVIPGLLK